MKRDKVRWLGLRHLLECPRADDVFTINGLE